MIGIHTSENSTADTRLSSSHKLNPRQILITRTTMKSAILLFHSSFYLCVFNILVCHSLSQNRFPSSSLSLLRRATCAN